MSRSRRQRQISPIPAPGSSSPISPSPARILHFTLGSPPPLTLSPAPPYRAISEADIPLPPSPPDSTLTSTTPSPSRSISTSTSPRSKSGSPESNSQDSQGYDSDDEISSVDSSLGSTPCTTPTHPPRAPIPSSLDEPTLTPYPILRAELNLGGLAIPLSPAIRGELDQLCYDLGARDPESEIRRWRFDMLILTMAHYFAIRDIGAAADAYLDEKGEDSDAFRGMVERHLEIMRERRPEYAALGLYP